MSNFLYSNTVFMDKAIEELKTEIDRGIKKYGSFKSFHESYAILLEENDELWDEIKIKPMNLQRIYEEAIQISAIALRIYIDALEQSENDRSEE